MRVILRSKDTGGRLLTLRAHTHVLEPGTPEWDKAAELLRASRLNAVDDSLTRWAEACTLTALVPFDAPLEAPGAYAAGDPGPRPRAPRPRRPRGGPGTGAAGVRRRPPASGPGPRPRPARRAARERAKLRAKRQRRGGRRRGG